MSQLTASPNRLALVLAGPTSDYGYTSFGAGVTTNGYVSENPVPTAQCANDGTCTYTFTHAIPADAKGTFTIGIEGRRGITLLAGTEQQMTSEYGAINKVINFSVDGSPVVARRKVVDIAKCNGCHSFLSLHGENRNQIEQCVLCHNPSETDAAPRAVATNPADKAAPAQGVNFAMMIHKIHTGEGLTEAGATYTIVGFGGSHNDFSEVRYPAMTPTGGVADTAKCYMCHVNNFRSELPDRQERGNRSRRAGSARRRRPRRRARPATFRCPPWLTHRRRPIRSLERAATSATATGADFDVNKVHAGK